MSFVVSTIWKVLKDHFYFCMLNVCGLTVMTRQKIVYLNLESASRPVPDNFDYLPVPVLVPLENGLQIPDEKVLCEETTSLLCVDFTDWSELEFFFPSKL